jgi:hypothetical protein
MLVPSQRRQWVVECIGTGGWSGGEGIDPSRSIGSRVSPSSSSPGPRACRADPCQAVQAAAGGGRTAAAAGGRAADCRPAGGAGPAPAHAAVAAGQQWARATSDTSPSLPPLGAQSLHCDWLACGTAWPRVTPPPPPQPCAQTPRPPPACPFHAPRPRARPPLWHYKGIRLGFTWQRHAPQTVQRRQRPVWMGLHRPCAVRCVWQCSYIRCAHIQRVCKTPEQCCSMECTLLNGSSGFVRPSPAYWAGLGWPAAVNRVMSAGGRMAPGVAATGPPVHMCTHQGVRCGQGLGHACSRGPVIIAWSSPACRVRRGSGVKVSQGALSTAASRQQATHKRDRSRSDGLPPAHPTSPLPMLARSLSAQQRAPPPPPHPTSNSQSSGQLPAQPAPSPAAGAG